ncbi:predicted protein [Naegleria gruberi]|uniref:Predicted protein n=1 Tax=Naegleria gruberi TaxID=5762 RepID=D2VPY8_NAEGR|nr:uncharacterized protein NAEGRDRAFT_80831 [Naegleria gruberi]EFC41014.1 predicted protein [Naegleria gruberi]|eukprot:XP_002673758.1 predicted protein [Naegleria gruberi strain NEG-M]
MKENHSNLILTLLFICCVCIVASHQQEKEQSTSDEYSSKIRKFTIPYDEKEWHDLKQTLNKSIAKLKSHPDSMVPFYSETDRAWKMGSQINQVLELAEYWKNEFDWKKQVDLMNELFPHYESQVDDHVTVRFGWRQAKSQIEKPLKERKVLMIVHGWPGSIIEFHRIINTLVDVHGFDVVVPSIPGYGYSSIPRKEGYHIGKVGQIFAQLMKNIGYGKYIVQGGDWGSMITMYVARADPENCIGYHSNMCLVIPNWRDWIDVAKDLITQLVSGTPYSSNTNSFSSFLSGCLTYITEEIGYQAMQSSKPDSIGVALLDSPLGLMNYILEKFVSWTDIEPRDTTGLFKVITRDEFLTNVMIYYTTNTIDSSMRKYYNVAKGAEEHKLGTKNYLQTPTACAVFKDLFRAPKSTAARNFNLIQYNRYEKGGHFAALENGQTLVDDLISFTEKVYNLQKTNTKNEL